MSDNTIDLSKFGYRELGLAGELLQALKTDIDKTRFLGDGVSVEFNPNSGNVFLVDDDGNVAMMNDGILEDFFSCPQCGAEGFLEEVKDIKNHSGSDKKECRDWIKQIKD